MRTTIQLVKRNMESFIGPIREGVRNNSLICKFVMPNCHSFIMIGFLNKNVKMLTNHEVCYKASSAHGVNCIVSTMSPLVR